MREYAGLIGLRLVGLALAIGLGFLLGAIFSPKLKGARRGLLMLVGVVLILFSLLSPTGYGDAIGYPVKIIAFLVAFAIGLRLGAEVIQAAAKRARPTSYGSAKWSTFEYLSEQGLFAEKGFLLGGFREGERDDRLRYDGARHLLTVAPTRSGKGVSSIIPNLLLHEGSAIVIDPKGENALITARRRGRGNITHGIPGLGQRVILLDPWDIAAPSLYMPKAKFNPLDWIKKNDPDAAENAFLLADALVIKEGGGETVFWDEEAKALLTGIILYVATTDSERTTRTLGRVRDILTLDDKEFDAILALMFNHPNPLVSSTASRTAAKEYKLRSSVLASAQAHTHFLESPRIRESLSGSDFSFDELKMKPTTVYLILPADRLSTFNRWLRLLIQQAITVNARNIHVKPKMPILFMLDEMPTLGRLPSLEQAFGLMAGFGMQLWGIVQDLSQLANIYGEHGWQTFISNSGVIQYFGSRDKMTAEYFSTLCGVTTIEVHNLSWAIGRALGYTAGSSSGSGGGSSSSGSSTTDSWTRTNGVSEAQRQLAYPDELMVLKGHEQIIFVENLDPIMAEKVVWYNDDAMRQLGTDLQKGMARTSLTEAALTAPDAIVSA
ncbi:MAG: type IV secretory system conjugative DNA transfer family protein [Bradyrhizobium sp.]|nr:type IV secretory system conjugative DNA transfer family protein [Bradyrhizobium sp.]